MKPLKPIAVIFVMLIVLSAMQALTAQTLSATVRFAESLREGPQDGRLLLILAKGKETEPRFQVRFNLFAQPVFGQDVEGWQAGEVRHFTDQHRGFPIGKISDLPPGEYQVQAVLNRYHTYNLSNGKTVKLPKDRWEGQQWQKKPGNFFSLPQTVVVDGKSDLTIDVVMDQKMPEIIPPDDTQYVKHIRMKSELLSEFWGEPVYLGAHVLIPHGFEEHPQARFPLMIFHGHFPQDLWGFRTTPPDLSEPPVYSERFGVEAYNHVQQQEAYDFYQKWISDNFPRYLVIEIQHPTPYYDDSYAVNSASQGPYGDALTYELIPYIEEKFRGIGEGWARFTYGGSTGGWEALAVQIFYPDEYNGAFVACPDPIDFRAFTNINIYEDENAYYYDGDFMKIARPGHRDYLGHISFTQAAYNHLELVLGSKSRSGQQYDIWEATYSPMGDDGYPQRIWDKETGKINKKVAAYWRENYDLRYILERDWPKIGNKLKGKIFIYTGDMDNYYLNNAVYLMEEFLESTTDPYYDGVVDYGDRAEHCWNGDHENPNHISRLRYNTMYLPKILKRIKESAPPGADLTSWRY